MSLHAIDPLRVSRPKEIWSWEIGLTHWAPMLFHFVVTTGLEEKQSSRWMVDQYSVYDHLNAFVLRLSIICTSRYAHYVRVLLWPGFCSKCGL